MPKYGRTLTNFQLRMHEYFSSACGLQPYIISICQIARPEVNKYDYYFQSRNMGTRRSHHIELTCEYENVTPDATLPHILDKKRLERIACASNAAKKKFSMFCDGNVLASKIY